jgi:N-acetylglucosaminyldiphosphoundecaprenol N-acetyl-beta-D-mannosaminyltransferase
MEKIHILGVGITQISKKEILESVKNRLNTKFFGKPVIIFTPNPEILVLAYKDNKFRDLLNTADFTIPDGFGLLLASGFRIRKRITGTDFMMDLCKMAGRNGFTIGLLGGKDGTAKKTAEVLKKNCPGLNIVFAVEDLNRLDSLGGLKRKSVDFLFVAMGAPKQERLLYTLKQQAMVKRQLYYKVGMGVGGAFDMICGKTKRAPLFMRNVGLEWLWRLILEPLRIRRIATAILVFPALLAWSKIRKLETNI